MILATRHNRTGEWSEESGPEGDRGSMQREREVQIASDGHVNWQDFLHLRGSEYLRITRADIEAIVTQDERDAGWKGKQRFQGRWHQGRLVSFAAMQGHSSRATNRIDMDLRLSRLDDEGDLRIPKILYHGTSRANVSSIFKHGLVAGGPGGGRSHVHMVGKINGTQEVSGVRSSSDTIIVIDGEAVMNDRLTQKHMSGNQVILMEKVRREFLLHALDRGSGKCIYMPRPGRSRKCDRWQKGPGDSHLRNRGSEAHEAFR